jgi:hypothetical protein
MVDRRRLLVAGLAVAVGTALFALGSGPGAPGGTVVTNDPPRAEVTAGADEVDVRFAGTGDWAAATLTVDWNGSLSVASGDRRLEAVGERVVLAAPDGGPVRVSVTATGDGRAMVVYRATLRP